MFPELSLVKRCRAALIIFVGVVGMSGLACRNRESPHNSEESHPKESRLSEFVGWQKCAQCHADVADTWLKTGHARTFQETRTSKTARDLDGHSFEDTERGLTFHYSFSAEQGLTVALHGQFENQPFPLDYLLGSNHHAQTFLTLIPHENGQTVGIEHRISLFGADLDLTPSQQNDQMHEPVQAFGRIQDPRTADLCIGCHTTSHVIREHRLEHVIPDVQCEACHGAGSEHVRAAERGRRVFLSDLNAEDPAGVLHQIEVCGSCHRLPRDVPAALIRPDYRQLTRFQPIGLMESECFKKSGGRLACSHCHDPHRPASSGSASTVAVCRNCHDQADENQQACPISPTNGCVECHMPQVQVHPRIAFHDHWIRIRPEHAGSTALRGLVSPMMFLDRLAAAIVTRELSAPWAGPSRSPHQ